MTAPDQQQLVNRAVRERLARAQAQHARETEALRASLAAALADAARLRATLRQLELPATGEPPAGPDIWPPASVGVQARRLAAATRTSDLAAAQTVLTAAFSSSAPLQNITAIVWELAHLAAHATTPTRPRRSTRP